MASLRSLLTVSLLLTALGAPLAGANHGGGDPHPGTVSFVTGERTPFAGGADDTDGDGKSEIFGTGAVVQIRLNDADLRNQASATVLVKSSQDSTGETVTLVKGDAPFNCIVDATNNPVTDCHFFGTIGVESTAVANNGRVAVSDEGELTIEYADANPAATRTVATANRLEWKTSAPGTIEFDQLDYFGFGTGVDAPKATVTVVDADRNLRSDAQDSLVVAVFGDADDLGIAGVDVILCERGVNTGIFEGVLTFTPTGASASAFGACGSVTPASLRVADGSVFEAVYGDEFDARGYPAQRSVTAGWSATHRAILDFTDKSYRQTVNTYRGLGSDLGFLRLEDEDLQGAGAVTVRVKSTQDGVGINVQLTETRANSGEFVGSFGFSTVGSGSGNIFVSLAGTNLLTAVYQDLATEAGTPGDAKDNDGSATVTANWARASTAVVRFMDSTFTTEATTAPATGSAFVEVNDQDANGNSGVADTLWIRVATAREPIGIPIQLKESGVNTNLFRGCFQFQNTRGGVGSDPEQLPCYNANGPTPSGRLMVRSGDVVRASHLDRFQGNGNLDVYVDDTITLTEASGAPTGTTEVKGTIRFFTSNSYQTETSAFFGIGGRAFVQVTEPLCNRNTGTVETLVVYVSSSLGYNPNAPHPQSQFTEWLADGSGFDNTVPGRNERIVLTESAPGSGRFQGEFGFELNDGPFIDNDAIDVGFGTPGAQTNPHQTTLVGVAYNYVEQTNGCGNAPATGGSILGGDTDPVDRVGIGSVHRAVTWTPTADAVVNFKDAPFEGNSLDSFDNPPATPGAAPAFVGLGKGYIQLTGTDLLEDTGAQANTVDVRVTSTADPVGIVVQLRERYVHSFDLLTAFDAGANQQAGGLHQSDDDSFRGEFGFTLGSSSDASDLLKVTPGDRIRVAYADSRNVNGASGSANQVATAKWIPATTSTLEMDRETYRSGQQATILLADGDRNVRPTQAETVTVRAVSSSDLNGVLLTLTETAPNSGVFQATGAGALKFGSTTSQGTNTLQVADGDIVAILYDDDFTATGSADERAAFAIWYDAQSAILALDSDAYTGTGDEATITLSDPDRNTADTTVQTVQAFVFSTTDGIGETLTLQETGPATGVFEGTFGFETSRVANNNKVRVATGDLVAAYYFDQQTTAGDPAENVARFAAATWTLVGNTPPTASLSVAPTTGTAPLDVTATLALSDSDGEIASYALDWGDGTTAFTGTGLPANLTQTHSYAAVGTFTVRWTVTDNLGAQATRSATVTVGTPATSTTTTSTSTSETTTSTTTTTTTTSSTTTTSGPPLPGLTPQAIELANKEIQVTVTRDGGINVITWELPDDLPADALGVQVWRSNSPYALVGTFGASSDEFQDGRVEDDSSSALASTSYLVTVYYGLTEALGFYDASSAPDTTVYGGTPVATTTGSSDLPTWALVLIVVGLASLGIVGVVAVVVTRRKSNPQDAPVPASSWDEPVAPAATPQGQYPVRCPSCQTSFTATGAKPIITVCPGCGKKGVLR